jgi:hypothetical protein
MPTIMVERCRVHMQAVAGVQPLAPQCVCIFAIMWTAIYTMIRIETAAKEATVMKTEEKQAAAPIVDTVQLPLAAPQEGDQPGVAAQPPKQPRPWHPSWIYAM